MESPVERESAWTKDDFRVVLYTTRIRDKEKRECGAMTVTGLQNATAKLDDGKHLQQCDECTQHLDRHSRASHLIAFEPPRLTWPEEFYECRMFIIDQLNEISHDTTVCLEWLQNLAKEMMAIHIIGADAEGADPERAAQECRRLIDLIHTKDFMPGP